MATTYVFRDTISDLATPANGRYYTKLLTATAAQVNVTSGAIAGGATVDGYAFTEPGVPGAEPGSIGGAWVVEMNVVTASTTCDVTCLIAQVSSTGTQKNTTSIATRQPSSPAGIKTFNFNTAAWTWAAGDRLRIDYRYIRTSTMGNETVVIGANTTSAEVVAPWTISAPPITINAVVAAATADAPTPAVISADAVTITALAADATADAPPPVISAAAGPTVIQALVADAFADIPTAGSFIEAEINLPVEAASATADAPPPVVSAGVAGPNIAAVVANATADMPAGGFVAADVTVEAVVGAASAAMPSPVVGGAAAVTVVAVAGSATADAPASLIEADRAATVVGVAGSATADFAAPAVTSADTTLIQAVAASATADAPLPTVTARRAVTVAATVISATADAPASTIRVAAAVAAAAAAASATFPAPTVFTVTITAAKISTYVETATQDRWIGTTRHSPFAGETATADRFAGTIRHNRFPGDTTRPTRFLGDTVAPDRFAGTTRPQRFYVTVSYREGETTMALTIVPIGPYTKNEVPESLVIRWLRTHADGTTSGLPLFSQTPAWTVTARIEKPSGAIVTRTCELLNPATLTTEFPDAADQMTNGEHGWVRMPFAAADFDEITAADQYGIQLVADQATPSVLLLKTGDVWQPDVNDGPAGLVVSSV